MKLGVGSRHLKVAIFASAAVVVQLAHFALPGVSMVPAYSLGSASDSSLFVIQRSASGSDPKNVLLQSTDGGATWNDRLHFAAIYDGMQMFGRNGFVWAVEMQPRDCHANLTNHSSCAGPPSYAVRLYRTSDGGVTWRTLHPGFPSSSVFFLDASRGWAVAGNDMTRGRAEVLYATSDGRTTWHQVGMVPASVPMSWVYGVGIHRVTFSQAPDGSVRGWYLGAGQLFTSFDGGATWQRVVLSVPAGKEAWIVTPSQPVLQGSDGVLAVGYRNPSGADNATAQEVYVYVSRDAGRSWSDPRTAPAGLAPVGDIFSAAVLDARHIWLTSLSLTGGDNVQAPPSVARTSDGGQTWKVSKGTPRILYMTFADAKLGYGLDVSGQYNANGGVKTADGGATWQRVTIPLF